MKIKANFNERPISIVHKFGNSHKLQTHPRINFKHIFDLKFQLPPSINFLKLSPIFLRPSAASWAGIRVSSSGGIT